MSTGHARLSMLHCTIGALTALEKGTIMNNRGFFSAIGDVFSVFGSAVAASRAVESGRKPRAHDLRNLGMEPAAFDKIRRF
ncbi:MULTISPECIES: hypothetical protein [unclassified Mesorhizobium]|uniref:hypothetical protein n=1 Tax=unclassified Mesorhizobium TaxID=325217 RepID=UPI0033388D31